MRHCSGHVSPLERETGLPFFPSEFGLDLTDLNFDGLVKSHQSRHPGESRGPEVLIFHGFRRLSRTPIRDSPE